MSVIDRALGRLPPVAPWVHFQGPLTEESFDLSVPEAMVAVMVASILADDRRSNEESARLTSALSTSRLFRHVTSEGNPDIVTRVEALLRERGRGPVLAECAKTIPPELRATAFANAVDLVLADGHVEELEKAYIDELQEILGIDDRLALNIAEVLAIKSRT
jgi:uncharacterized tellurite resistance protein B-like protein